MQVLIFRQPTSSDNYQNPFNITDKVGYWYDLSTSTRVSEDNETEYNKTFAQLCNKLKRESRSKQKKDSFIACLSVQLLTNVLKPQALGK